MVAFWQDARTCDALEARIAELGLDIRLDDDLSPLWRPVDVGPGGTPNALAVHPMEGFDGTADGAPGELTYRRYRRFAEGGAGLIWFEATAVVAEGRSSPNQLWLRDGTVGEFTRLVAETLRVARSVHGDRHRPLTVLQLTHSGRQTRIAGRSAPVAAHRDPALAAESGLPLDHPIVSDAELDALQDDYVAAARLARRAGFDAVDVKACHGCLPAELLASHTRAGRYGGSFENRTRFLREVIERIHVEVPDLLLAVRINGHDGSDHAYSWGMSDAVPGQVDLGEPIRLVSALHRAGVSLLSVSLGAQTRPASHPLEVTADHIVTTRSIQRALPELVVVGAGYSQLRQHFSRSAAANLRDRSVSIVGLGRGAIAYPDFPRDLLASGRLDPKRICVLCDRCFDLVRAGFPAGCVTRDAKVYLPFHRQIG